MRKNKLLTRKDFTQKVLELFEGKCCFCSEDATAAHHIVERKLFDDGGYYLDNGAPVCDEHHLDCEKTLISTQEVRDACGISNIILPEIYENDENIDKWGNIILKDQTRLPGPLFYDDGVQKILKEANLLSIFRPWTKYPKTYHLPWSKSTDNTDRIIKSTNSLSGLDVVVTEKMDGENTTLYFDHIHARSIDSVNHPSRSWVKSFWSSIKHDIPKGWRICGENCYAKHSIEYDNLDSYFLGFSIWDERQNCLSWDDTIQWFDLLGIISVPVLYKGLYDEKIIKSLWNESKQNTMEGYVVRPKDQFHSSQFSSLVGKFVRPQHVQSSKHWMRESITPNKLRI